MSIADPFRRTGRIEGRCTCGASRIVVDGAHVAAVGACHCLMCQRWNGMLSGTFEASAEAVTATGPVSRYATSSFAERAFCGTCGAGLWIRTLDDGAVYDLMPGLFEAASDWPLISEIYSDRAPAYACLSGDHIRQSRADYEARQPFVEGDAS